MALPVEWMALTGDQFVQAREAAGGVCLVPIGVLERHAPHLPTGTDVYEADAVAKTAAGKEYAVVLPPVPYSVNDSSVNCPGAIDLRLRVLLDFFENLLDEVARNGFSKIILVNFHGGNHSLLPALVAAHKCRDVDYDLYLPQPGVWSAPGLKGLLTAVEDGHAGELETSLIMHVRPDLVDGAKIPAFRTLPRPGYPVAWVRTSVDWVASFPDHYSGDARLASPEKGAQVLEIIGDHVAQIIRDVKADTATAAVRREFQAQRRKPTVGRRTEAAPD